MAYRIQYEKEEKRDDWEWKYLSWAFILLVLGVGLLYNTSFCRNSVQKTGRALESFTEKIRQGDPVAKAAEVFFVTQEGENEEPAS